MNEYEIDGAHPRIYTSKKTLRNNLNVSDIDGAKPLHMKGYSGFK